MTNIIDKYDDLEILNIISEARNFTLSELVFRKIRSMILNGEILSGEKIHENNISDELNVSRGPVREATRRLSQIGLLEYTAQKGLKVKEFNINEIEELYEISISLCKLSGKLIYKNINTKIINELEIVFNSFNQISKKDYKNNHYLLSLKFSENIVAEVHLDFLQRTNSRSLKIIGSKGTLFWDYYKKKITFSEYKQGKKKLLIKKIQ